MLGEISRREFGVYVTSGLSAATRAFKSTISNPQQEQLTQQKQMPPAGTPEREAYRRQMYQKALSFENDLEKKPIPDLPVPDLLHLDGIDQIIQNMMKDPYYLTREFVLKGNSTHIGHTINERVASFEDLKDVSSSLPVKKNQPVNPNYLKTITIDGIEYTLSLTFDGTIQNGNVVKLNRLRSFSVYTENLNGRKYMIKSDAIFPTRETIYFALVSPTNQSVYAPTYHAEDDHTLNKSNPLDVSGLRKKFKMALERQYIRLPEIKK